MTTLWSDIRYGLRMMQRNAGFTAIAIAMLALGIGANTAIFSVVDAALLRPLPFRAPDQLVQLWETESVEGQFPLTGADYLDWRGQNQSFEDMAAYTYQKSFNASGAGEPERVSVVQTQANFFSILGLQPILGRSFIQGEDQPGQNHVVILSNAFWQTHFGGQGDALNKSVELNGDPYTVVGIMPGWYRSPGAADMWIPIDATPKALGPRGQHHLRAIGRIKNGTTLAQAGADLRTIAGRIEKQYPNENTKVSAMVIPLKEQIVDGSRTQIWIMFGAVTLVLLIASVNVANLLLARATGRRREIAVRAAMGATRWSLIRQLLTESVLLSIFGAIPGVWLAYLCVDWLSSLQTIPVPQANPIGVNLSILLFTLGVSILVGILFGLIPAIQSSQVKVYEELKSGGKMALTSNLGGRVVRNVLVVVEIALSLSLLTGAGLLIRTFSNLREVNIGVRSDKILTASVLLPPGRYATADQQQSFFYRLVQELAAAPGVKGAAIASELPLQGGNNSFITIPGQSDESVQNQLVEITAITPNYFRVMGIPLVAGRGLTAADLENTASAYRKLLPLFISGKFKPSDADFVLDADISEAMAARFWPQQDPIGKQFAMDGIPVRVAGVVGNIKVFNLRQKAMAQAYFGLPWELGPNLSPMHVVLQSSGQPRELAGILQSKVKSLDSSLAVFGISTIPEMITDSMTDTNYETFLLGVFAGLSLLLASAGIYGVISFLVSNRTSEIGIRMALGAGRNDILWMVLRQGFALIVAGITVGIAATFALTYVVKSLLYGVTPTDPVTLTAVSILMAIVATAACLMPALRATRVDPLTAVRYE